MSEWIRIKIKDFYKDAVGETEFTYVSNEVYEALADTFRREAHAEEMRDLRHLTACGYIEGETEERIAEETESLEDMVIHQMELETLQEAVQRERLHLYFFEGLTFRQIAEKTGISDMSVREIVEASLLIRMSSAQQILDYRKEIDENQRQIRDMVMESYRDIAVEKVETAMNFLKNWRKDIQMIEYKVITLPLAEGDIEDQTDYIAFELKSPETALNMVRGFKKVINNSYFAY